MHSTHSAFMVSVPKMVDEPQICSCGVLGTNRDRPFGDFKSRKQYKRHNFIT